jgi:hypothetical protein
MNRTLYFGKYTNGEYACVEVSPKTTRNEAMKELRVYNRTEHKLIGARKRILSNEDYFALLKQNKTGNEDGYTLAKKAIFDGDFSAG